MTEENILVVSTELFHRLGYFQGFSKDIEKYRSILLAPENVSFGLRSQMENNPDFKQLIPYMIFCYTDNAGQLSIFTYIRGKGQGEARLHQKMSIGVGGHLNDHDKKTNQQNTNTFHDLYHEGMFREFHEEVRTNSPYTECCVGMINDDLTEVGKVHLGIVHRFDLVKPDLVANEKDLIESGFRPVEELLALPEDRFESWTSISLKALFA